MFRRTTAANGQTAGAHSGANGRWTGRFGLSGKLFVFTVAATMLAEVIFYVPSIATFRITWLTDRLAAAHTAALVLKSEDADSRMKIPESVKRELLASIGA